MEEGCGPWIDFSGGTCPVVGKYVQIVFNDGDREEGQAIDHVYWYYVDRYRVRREVERDGGNGYDVERVREDENA